MRKFYTSVVTILAAIAVAFGGMAPAIAAPAAPVLAAPIVVPAHDPGTDRWWSPTPNIKSVDVTSRYILGVDSLGKSSKYSSHLHTIYLGTWSKDWQRLDWACAKKNTSRYKYKTYTRSETRSNNIGMTSWSRLYSGCEFIGHYGQVKTYRSKF